MKAFFRPFGVCRLADRPGGARQARSALHQAGARVLTELLRFAEPAQREVPCPCGQQARYQELRSKQILTALGEVEISLPCYRCPYCHAGQFPADQELDIANTGFRPACGA